MDPLRRYREDDEGLFHSGASERAIPVERESRARENGDIIYHMDSGKVSGDVITLYLQEMDIVVHLC